MYVNTRISYIPFLGAFAKIVQTISFVMSVCPCIHMKQLGSHWMNFHEILNFFFFLMCWKNWSFIKI